MLRSRQRGFKTGIAIAAVLSIALASACFGPDQTAVSPSVVSVVRIPPVTAIPTIVATPLRLPTPTAAPVTNLGQTAVEIAVWRQISQCAEQIFRLSDSTSRLDFNSVFSIKDSSWFVEASSENLGLSFGRWKIVDATEEVAPINKVARDIASPGIVCRRPNAMLSKGLTPPRIQTPTPRPPTPTATSSPTVTPSPTASPFSADIERAELLVWDRLRSCVNQIVVSSGKTVEIEFLTNLQQQGLWKVKASSLGLSMNLGSWEVDNITNQVTAIDVVSEAISSTEAICQEPEAELASGLTPPLITFPGETHTPLIGQVTEEQARLKVWAAVRSCYPALLSLDNFTAYVENPQRWLVVGTGEDGANYGMWFVDVANGGITPHDTRARATASNIICFIEP